MTNIVKLRHKVEKHYEMHGAPIKVISTEPVRNGERFIFTVKLKAGTKESLIFDRAADIRTALQVPLLQPFKDNMTIKIVISCRPTVENSLCKMLLSPTVRRSDKMIPISLGYNIRGDMFFADLVNLVHVLYAGASGSGKSMGLCCLILSIAYLQSADQVNLIIFDVGANSLTAFKNIPHLAHPIVKDIKTAVHVISELEKEMDRRYKLESDELKSEPAIVSIMDEYISMILNFNNDRKVYGMTDSISNLLRRGRQAKIHMVLAAQDPTVKSMKVDLGNITARIAFMCARFQNSITILGEGGAEKLSGNGAMLFKSGEYPKPIYIQGAYVSQPDVNQLVSIICSRSYDTGRKFVIQVADMLESSTYVSEAIELSMSKMDKQNELANVIIWVLGHEVISASSIKKHYNMGNRVNAIVDKLHDLSIISDKNHNQPRVVLPKSIEDLSDEVIQLLKRYGYDEIQISYAFRSDV